MELIQSMSSTSGLHPVHHVSRKYLISIDWKQPENMIDLKFYWLVSIERKTWKNESTHSLKSTKSFRRFWYLRTKTILVGRLILIGAGLVHYPVHSLSTRKSATSNLVCTSPMRTFWRILRRYASRSYLTGIGLSAARAEVFAKPLIHATSFLRL